MLCYVGVLLDIDVIFFVFDVFVFELVENGIIIVEIECWIDILLM